MPNVVVYRDQLLRSSETFIRAQVCSLSRWHGILVGKHPVRDGLNLRGIDTRILPAPTMLDRCARAIGLGVPSISRALKAANPDLVHVHFGTDAVDLWPSLAPLRLPVLVTLHGFDINTEKSWWATGQGGEDRRDYPDRLLDMAQSHRVGFIAVSEAIRLRAIEFGLPAERIHTRHIGTDTTYFSPSTEVARVPEILFVGRLVEKKGVEYLIRACAEAFRGAPGARLIVAGDGPLRQPLEALAHSLGVDAHFEGAVSVERARALMQRARALCLPSVTAANGDAEGFGMVLLEAQACGTPVLSSAKGGAEEGLIDSVTGFRFPERDVRALVEHLGTILSDDALFRRQSEAAVQFVRQKFDLSEQTKALETLYDRAKAGPYPSESRPE